MNTLTFSCPLPPGAVSPNQQYDHWRKRASAAKSYREVCMVLSLDAVRRAGWKAPAKARVDLVVGTADQKLNGKRLPDGRYRPRDPSNAVSACKALLDGLQDAGAIVGDHGAVLVIGEVSVDRSEGPGVTVTITAIEDGE